MPDIIRGMEGLTDTLASEKIIDVSKKIWLLKPSISPFNVFLQKLPKRRIDSTEFKLFEDEKLPEWDTVRANYLVADTNIPVVNGKYFLSNTIIMNTATGERMYVRGVTLDAAGDTLQVVRKWGQTTAYAGLINQKILIISSAIGEKAKVGTESLIVKKTEVSNKVQKFAKKISLTNEQLKHKMYGEDRRVYETRKIGEAFVEEIEKQYLLGTEEYKDVVHLDGVIRRVASTNGVLNILTTASKQNYLKGAGVLTETDFDKNWLPVIFGYGSRDNKVAFVSAMWISLITSWAKDKMIFEDRKSKEYGIEIWKYISPFGKLNLVYHPLFVYDYDDLGLVIDMECVEDVIFADEDTKLYKDLQNREEGIVGGIVDMYYRQSGLFLANVLNHTILRLEEV
jgi:hypothetical protein